MKKAFVLFLVVTSVAGLYSCRKKGVQPPEYKIDSALLKDTTQIVWLDSTTFHFDTINYVETGWRHTLPHEKYRAKEPQSFARALPARAAARCPNDPKDPVKPGDTATIHVTFNSLGKENAQNKNVTIICNTEQRNEMVYLNGFVRVKK